MPKQSTIKTNILGYDVEVPEDHNVAQLHAFIRAFKQFHKNHRLSCDVVLTLPVWRPDLLKD